MSTLYCIDPGPRTCGTVRYCTTRRRVLYANKAEPVEDVLTFLATTKATDHVAIERVSAGPSVGSDLILTAELVGRLMQQCEVAGLPYTALRRYEVCSALGVVGKSKDTQVRWRCIEILADGDAKAAKGTKHNPGPCRGVASHSWQALGLGLVVARQLEAAR